MKPWVLWIGGGCAYLALSDYILAGLAGAVALAILIGVPFAVRDIMKEIWEN